MTQSESTSGVVHRRGASALADLVAEMEAYYAQRAPIYDASMGYDDPERVARLEPVVAALEDALSGRSVLEVACGPGFWTERVSKFAKSVVATDLNDSVLALTRQRFAGVPNVRIEQVDAYQLPSDLGPFDAAFAVDWLAHVPNSRMHEFLVGLHAQLESGSRVVFCDGLPRAGSFTGVHDGDGNHLQVRELPDGSRHRVIKHFLSDEETRELLRPYSTEVEILTLSGAGRRVVSYRLAE
jgi:SAM-dependent methyltransferase